MTRRSAFAAFAAALLAPIVAHAQAGNTGVINRTQVPAGVPAQTGSASAPAVPNAEPGNLTPKAAPIPRRRRPRVRRATPSTAQ